MSASSVIALRGLSKRYGDVVALEGLDLEVAAGECVALIGHNGSGKTTTMRLAAGQLESTSGSVTVAGIDIHRAPDAHRARAALAFVPDSPLLYDDLTVAEHLELVGLAHGVGDALDERIAVLLDVLDPPSQASLRELLEEAKSEGIAIVLSTHQLRFSEGLADRAVVLHDGRVIDAGDYDPVVAGKHAARLGLR